MTLMDTVIMVMKKNFISFNDIFTTSAPSSIIPGWFSVPQEQQALIFRELLLRDITL